MPHCLFHSKVENRLGAKRNSAKWKKEKNLKILKEIQTKHTFNSGNSITHPHSTTSAPTRSERQQINKNIIKSQYDINRQKTGYQNKGILVDLQKLKWHIKGKMRLLA